MVKNQYIVSGEEGEVVYAMEAQERPEYEAQYIPEEELQQEEGGGYVDEYYENNGFIEEEVYEENLGDDFEDTPWVPPSLILAEEYKRKHIWREGKADPFAFDITQVPDLGIGVPLYFQFVKSAAIFMLICTFLSLPLLLFATTGSRIPQQAQDGLGLYRITFGNIGADPLSKTYASTTACHNNIVSTINGTCIHFYGNELTSLNASYVVTALEITQIFLFYAVLAFLHSKTKTFKLSTERELASVTSYAIMVRNIPPDTTEEQLVAHFTRLYPLDKRDWMDRPVLEDAKPVKEFDNTDDVMYYNTWIAEVNTHKKIGLYVTAFQSQQSLMEKILRGRAKMKMYNENTCHADGPNIKKFLAAEKEMLEAGSALDRLTEKIAKNAKMVLKEDAEEEEEDHDYADRGNDGIDEEMGGRRRGNSSPMSTKSGASRKSHKSSKSSKSDHHIVADVTAGFVIFQYSESMARCLEDYASYDTFPMSLLTPSALKLRGHTIEVKQALQPDELIWENIEVTDFNKRLRYFRTTFFTILLLILSFIFILQADLASNRFLQQVPLTTLCQSDIPAVYLGGYDVLTNIIASHESLPIITRPPEASAQLKYDASCSAIQTGTFYGVYASNGNFSAPAVSYNLSACVSSGGLCPQYEEPSFCPCLSTSSTQTCSTSACSPLYRDDSTRTCSTYPAGFLGACFCLREFSQATISITSSISNLVSPVCQDFIVSYLQAKAIVYSVSFVTVVINMLIRELQVYLTKKESHSSFDRAQGSLMLKVFVSTYFNLAIVYLLVFGSIPYTQDNSFLKSTYILQGRYNDFNVEWYGSVGSALVISFLLQLAINIFFNLFYYFVVSPYYRNHAFPRIQARKSHSIVMQQDLNALMIGYEFDLSVSTALHLALFFFSMTYATALPILLPLTFITFSASYVTDKFLLCRYYPRPPYSGTGVMNAVLACLPWAAVLRIIVACWVFSNPGGFDYESAFDPAVSSFTASYGPSVQGYLPAWIESRLIRTNVFPLILLLLLILLVKMIILIYKIAPLSIVMRYLRCVFHVCRRRNKIHMSEEGEKARGYDLFMSGHDLRQECAPFTEPYFRYISDNTARIKSGHAFYKHMALTLSKQEVEAGWVLRDKGRYTIKEKLWTRIVRETGKRMHQVGDLKNTYEVIADSGCNSYNLDKVPAYKMTMIGLKEGTASMAATVNTPFTANSTKSGKVKLTHTPSVLGVYKKNLRKTSFVETHLERRRSKMGLGMELPTGFSINPLLASVDEATPLQAQESLESDFGTGLGHHQQLFGASGDAEGGDGGEAAFALLEHQLIEEEEGYAVDEEQPLKMLSSDHHGGKGFMGGYQHQTKLRLDINDL